MMEVSTWSHQSPLVQGKMCMAVMAWWLSERSRETELEKTSTGISWSSSNRRWKVRRASTEMGSAVPGGRKLKEAKLKQVARVW